MPKIPTTAEIEDYMDWGNLVEVDAHFKRSLRQLSAETGKSVSELLVSALGLLVIALREEKQGNELYILKKITGL